MEKRAPDGLRYHSAGCFRVAPSPIDRDATGDDTVYIRVRLDQKSRDWTLRI